MKKTIWSNKKYFKLGKVPIGIGAIIDGWNFTEKEFRNSNCLNTEFRAFTNKCPLNCTYCFTEKMQSNLSLKEIKTIIAKLKKMGTRTINFVGEGEPTIDTNFLDVIKYCSQKKIKSIVFSAGTTKFKNREFLEKLKKYNVSIILKCDSLFNKKYQNEITESKNYFKLRNEILQILIKEGFNKPNKKGTTNLGLDMIVTNKNKKEALKTVEFGRKNNIFVMIVEYLPTGKTKNVDKDLMLKREKISGLRKRISQIDAKKYSFKHSTFTSYTSVPCTIYGGIHIYGNGNVSQCAGNAKVLGNLRKEPLEKIFKKIKLDKSNFEGECPYRIQAYKK